MLPFSLSGTVVVEVPTVAGATLDHALTSIMSRLSRELPSSLSRSGDCIEFEAGLFRMVGSWNELIAVHRGQIRVEQSSHALRVQYDLWFTQLLIVVTLAVVCFFGPPVVAAPNLTTAGKLAILASTWFWLAAGNIALTAYRFPRLIGEAVGAPTR